MNKSPNRPTVSIPRPQRPHLLHAAADTNVEDYQQACRHRARLSRNAVGAVERVRVSSPRAS